MKRKQLNPTKWVDSLTDEQMARIYQIIDPISDEERREIEKDLYAELTKSN